MSPLRPIKVAIIGGGPGGLGAAIEFSRLAFADWQLYEKKPAISETGGGISLQRHTWRMLELNGVAGYIREEDFFRPEKGHSAQHRNGRTGVLLAERFDTAPRQQQSCRMVRAKLQAALLRAVDTTRVHCSKKLVRIEQLNGPGGKLEIMFEDGFADEVDLLVGADGIRSFVRQYAFPAHSISYIGQSAYRTIISKSRAVSIRDMPWVPVFWHNVGGKYVFTCPLGGDDFEVTARIRQPQPADGQEQVSWGRPYDFRQLLHEYDEFCPPVRAVVQLAAESDPGTQEFALFAGPRLDAVVANGAVALIGDAAHPLSGAFGAGAGFALEDCHALRRCVEWAWTQENPLPLGDGLALFDSVRSSHYRRLYSVLDKMKGMNAALLQEGLDIDSEIEERVRRAEDERWMYHYKVDEAVDELLQGSSHYSQRR